VIDPIVWPTLFASAFALTIPTISSDNTLRKCDGHPAGRDPIVMVDGAITNGKIDPVVKDLDPEQVYSIEILCMNPEDSTLNKTQGIGVASVWTRQGIERAAIRTLTAIVEAQDAHFRKESRYLDDISGIALPLRPPELLVTVEAIARGWIARAVVDRMPLTCAVYDGTVRAPQPGLLPRQPTC
jgi:hypothetical protein